MSDLMCREPDCQSRPHRLYEESHDFSPPPRVKPQPWVDPRYPATEACNDQHTAGIGEAETWRCPSCRATVAPMGMCQRCGVYGLQYDSPEVHCTCVSHHELGADFYDERSLTLRSRLGPFPNELDAVRSLHARQEVATPDDHSDVMCAVCYILDEGWPCTVARLIAILDAQLAAEETR